MRVNKRILIIISWTFCKIPASRHDRVSQENGSTYEQKRPNQFNQQNIETSYR